MIIGNMDDALARIDELSDEFAKTYSKRDLNNEYPREEMEKLKQSGLLGFSVPKSYGGLGSSCADITRAIISFSQGNPAIGQMFLVHCLLGASFLDELAPESMKKKVFADIVGRNIFLGNAASEKSNDPKKGYDLTLTPVDGGVEITGKKFFSTGSLAGDQLAVIGMCGSNMGLAIVPSDAKGLQIINDWDAMGQRGTGSGTTIFDKVFAPSEMVMTSITDENRQMAVTNLLGPITQVGFTGVFIGAAKGAMREATQYVKEKTRAYPWPGLDFDKAVDDPYILSTIGGLSAQLAAAEAMAYEAARLVDKALNARAGASAKDMASLRAAASVAVSQAKIVATDTGLKVCQDVFTACGARSALREQNMDRFWRDIRTLSLHDPLSFRTRSVGEYLLQNKFPTPALRY
ncbi:MAG: acyl-CoA dehydrogenase family protein [Gammaproteobacteria bacterium]|nr:acyl-CoA dehydrogenase family protein [Gammaproteobacteria bacterium]MBQ0838380.1 acyl-CoA dehydrogenase family protein [Gammaproteobacteria bacterium]